MTDALPTSPDDEPERQITIREIPATILDLRQRLAQAQTERNAAVNALSISRKNVDDLTDHAMAQGKHIADLGSQLAKSEALGTQWLDHYLAASATKWKLRDELKALEKRIAALVEYVEADLEHKGEGTDWPHVRELIEAAGVECPECEGKREVADEEMIPVGGPSNDYTTRRVSVECERCDGIGSVLR